MLGQNYRVSYLSVKDGLSQNEVTSIVQDKYGFMWFGTRGGLNRYDGYEFHHYKPRHDKTTSIQNASIERLYIDSQDNIWIGTKSEGFSVFDVKKEHFIHPPDTLNLKTKRVISFAESKDGMLVGHWADGMVQYKDIYNWENSLQFFGNVNSIISLHDSLTFWGGTAGLRFLKGDTLHLKKFKRGYSEVTEIVKDPEQPILWMVGWGADLVRYNYENQTHKVFKLPFGRDSKHSQGYSLLFDQMGDIWIGTWGSGLFRFNKATESFESINIAPKGALESNVDYNIILDIFQDDAASIWVGTEGGGVVKISPNSQFNSYGDVKDTGINQKHINAVLEDSKGNLWVGTKSEGLYLRYDDFKFRKIHFANRIKEREQERVIIRKIYEDENDLVWVSCNTGLFIVDNNDARGTVLVEAGQYSAYSCLPVIKKAQDILIHNSEMWVATQQRGLYLFEDVKGKYILKKQFLSYEHPDSLKSDRITSVNYGDNERLWVASYNGLFLYQPNDSAFLPVADLVDGQNTPLSETILCFHIDKKGSVWYGTSCSLCNLIELDNGNFTLNEYTRDDGLPDDYINGILSDDNGNMWVSTNAGLSKFDPLTTTFENYDTADGIASLNFSSSASCYGKQERMYFGSFRGLTYFTPSVLSKNNFAPPIVITDFKILNKNIQIKPDGILPKSVNEIKQLVLSHQENEFSFEFAALDYKAPHRNQYAYWLEGRDSARIVLGNRRHVSFSNLKPGEYTLHLYGSNSNGKWNNDSRKIEIKIKPAPWKTIYAFMVYVCVILFMVIGIVRFAKKQERLESAVRLQKEKRERTQEINDYKLRFFTNVSHELRTPLTLILSPLNEIIEGDMLDKTSVTVTSKLMLVQKNANRLFDLVNKLLEFRKIEAEKVVLQASKSEFVSFLSEITSGYNELAKNRNIQYQKKIPRKEIDLYFDQERLRVVFNNLLSNAFKFCGASGLVKVTLNEESDRITVVVENDGKGIKEADLSRLFERFYQVKGGASVNSSGIGLSIVKSYVDLHHGQIEVKSKENDMTSFSMVLKKGREHIRDIEIIENVPVNSTVEILPEFEAVSNTRTSNMGTKGATVLLVEDNNELREYLVDILSNDFNCIEASDGQQGLDLILEDKPDIVISDLMMPLMDGYELCERIKSNDLISHIPVIILTAKGALQDNLLGTRKGADAYLTKPFNSTLLIEKVKQLVASRKLLSNKYSEKVKLEPTDAEIEKADSVFVKKAMQSIEKNMEDVNYDYHIMASDLAVSGSTLYRKIKKILNMTPGEFIKSIRLKRAAQLLKESDLTITEILDRIGYLDIKNFRQSFKKQYHLTPSQYRAKEREAN